jgi:cytochrome c-type biogenesis protein
MIDPFHAGISTLVSPSAFSFLLLLFAGILTSIGPCIAPRYIAVTALAGAARRPLPAIGAFVAGLIGAYVLLGFAAGGLGMMVGLASTMNSILAVVLFIGGLLTLARARVEGAACAHTRHGSTFDRSIGGVFLLGATSALVVSPCCTPVIVAIFATSSAMGRPIAGALSLGIFALGHTLPLMVAGFAGATFRNLARIATSQAPGIVAGALMVALGLYYGALA